MTDIMQTAKISSSLQVGGLSFLSSVERSAEGQISQVVPLPAGIAGAVSSGGVDGLVEGHGLVQNDVIDVHWTVDDVPMCRRGVTVDGATATAITFDNSPAAEGDALPALATAVVVSKQVPIITAFAGNDVLMIGIESTQTAFADFRSTGASVLAKSLPAGEAWSWWTGLATNPLAGGAIAKVVASNGTTTAATLSLGVLYNSVA